MKKRYYIAYGSNLNLRQMKYRCPTARVVGTATIPGYQLLFKGSKTGSYLTIEKKDGYEVPVAVWEVTALDERSLDSYEGYPTFYYKQEVILPVADIESGEIKTCRAFVYIMHEDRPIGIPTAHYMAVCMKGYDDFDFDPQFLIDAYNYSTQEAEK